MYMTYLQIFYRFKFVDEKIMNTLCVKKRKNINWKFYNYIKSIIIILKDKM